MITFHILTVYVSITIAVAFLAGLLNDDEKLDWTIPLWPLYIVGVVFIALVSIFVFWPATLGRKIRSWYNA